MTLCDSVAGLGHFPESGTLLLDRYGLVEALHEVIPSQYRLLRDVVLKLSRWGSGRFIGCSTLKESTFYSTSGGGIEDEGVAMVEIVSREGDFKFQPEDRSFLGAVNYQVSEHVRLFAPGVMVDIHEGSHWWSGRGNGYLNVKVNLVFDDVERGVGEDKRGPLTRENVLANLEVITGFLPRQSPVIIDSFQVNRVGR